MPLTAFQSETLRLLAAHRSPESFLAGGTVLNAGVDSPRYSKDLDIFHDVEASVVTSAETDAATLRQAGYGVEWLLRQPLFQRAEVVRNGRRLLVEWLFDSAFRFFPVEPDDLAGWRLNLHDAATNKLLALMGRGDAKGVIHTSPGQRPGFISPKTPLALKARFILRYETGRWPATE